MLRNKSLLVAGLFLKKATNQMLFFLGPLPPPLHGFSAINAEMLSLLEAKAQVQVFNRATSSDSTFLATFRLWLRFAILLLRGQRGALYMGLSGGKGQLIDAPFVLFARLFGLRIYVHHHSFAYINTPTWLSRFVIRLLGKAEHILLCDAMGVALSEQYQLDSNRIHALSNAAFLTDAPRQVCNIYSKNLRIGFLSNITEEKGIFEFFAVMSETARLGLPVEGLIAGPVEERIRVRFEEALALAGNVKHLGAVYGQQKESFFASIDVLLFPTKYPNEAEPVTILEAFRVGVPVLAAQRGCIATLIGKRGGIFVPHDEFVSAALKEVQVMATNPDHLAVEREKAHSRFKHLQDVNKRKLNTLIEAICGTRVN